MKKILSISMGISLLLTFLGNAMAQTNISFDPYSYTVGTSKYQVTASFATQLWGDTYMLVTLTNKGTTSIDMSGGNEIWFNASATPTVINFPSLGGLSYPTNSVISTVPQGSYSLIQTNISFPTESWATTLLAPNQSFAVNYNIGSSIQSSEFASIAQSCKLYAMGWVRPNLYVPLAITLTGNQGLAQTINVVDKTVGSTTPYRITSSSTVNVLNGNTLAVWGRDSLAGSTLYKSTYTSASPLVITAISSATSVSLPYSTTTLPSGTMNVQVSGLPTGVSTKLVVSSSTYPISKEVAVVNGANSIPALPYDTYTVVVSRYVSESTNTSAVPSYASTYNFSSSTVAALSVSFTSSAIKPFSIDGWPKYLSMGSITLADEGNDVALSKTPLNAIFKYSGSGMGDTGHLLDASSPNFPTTKTMQQARRLEANYKSKYPNLSPTTVMPVMVHYTAQASGGGVGGDDVYTDTNLGIHYQNLIRETKVMLSFKDDAHPYPGTYVLNPDLLGAQQQSYGPTGFNDSEVFNRTIHVNEQLKYAFQQEGLSTASLPTFSENWPGYYQSINYLIKTIGQGAIKFGWQLNVWATGTALWVYDNNNLAKEKAGLVTSFADGKMGVFSGQWKPDFVVLDRYEADCFSVRGQNYAYNVQAWDRFVEYASTIGKNLNLPVMLWQIPGGHLVTKAETIRKYNISNHSSASATYFLGDANVGVGTNNVRDEVLSLPLLPINTVYNTSATTIGPWLNQVPNYDYTKSQLQKLADNNIFSILWGGGETIAVAPIGTNGDDDGWLANRLVGYYQNDKVYQQQTINPTTPTITITAPANNASLSTGSSLTISVSIANATASKVEYYNGATLIGTSLTAPFAYTMSNLTAGNYALTAKATTPSGVITSSIVNVLVTTVSCTAAPTISLATPIISGSGPATVSLNATASVSCGTISKVEFYNGTTLLSTVTTAPYSFSWPNVAAGTYSLTARAYANNTLTSSGSMTITVSASTNPGTGDMCAGIAAWNASTEYATVGTNVTYQGHLYTSVYWTKGNAPKTPYVQGDPWKDLGTCSSSCTAAPTISLATPVVSGGTVTLNATASVSCGAVAKVEFYRGTTLIGTVTNAPYNYTWANAAAGTYSLTAKAYANNTSTTSSAVIITIGNSAVDICAGVAAWNASTEYATAGTKVTYQGHLYVSMYWTKGNTPKTPYVQGEPWKDSGTCSAARVASASEPIESEIGHVFTTYPNPTEGVIYVEFYVNENDTEVRFELIDLKSNRAYFSHHTFSRGNQKITLQPTNLPDQVYILQVTTSTGQKIGTQKVIYLK